MHRGRTPACPSLAQSLALRALRGCSELRVRPGTAGPKERRRTLEIRLITQRDRTRSTNAEPGRSVASLATMTVTASAMRRCASTWAVDETVPKMHFRWPRVSACLKAASSSPITKGEETATPRGIGGHGTCVEGGPVTWETLISPREEYRHRGEPATRLRRACVADARDARSRTSIRRRGRPCARDDHSDGRRGSGSRRAAYEQ